MRSAMSGVMRKSFETMPATISLISAIVLLGFEQMPVRVQPFENDLAAQV